VIQVRISCFVNIEDPSLLTITHMPFWYLHYRSHMSLQRIIIPATLLSFGFLVGIIQHTAGDEQNVFFTTQHLSY
jgi:hypothetical protein